VLKVREYFLLDPLGDYLDPSLQGYRLQRGVYRSIKSVKGRLTSQVLGVEMERQGKRLALFDAVTGLKLLLRHEREQLRAEAEKARAEVEKVRAETEKARAEVEKVRAETEKARADSAEARAEAAVAEAREAKAQRERAEAEMERLRRELAASRGGPNGR
jgi:chromosome segregation ATPase